MTNRQFGRLADNDVIDAGLRQITQKPEATSSVSSPVRVAPDVEANLRLSRSSGSVFSPTSQSLGGFGGPEGQPGVMYD